MRKHNSRRPYIGLIISIFAAGLLFTLGVSGKDKRIDAQGLRESLGSLSASSAQARELSSQFSNDKISPNYFRIQMNSILRDLQISRDHIEKAEADASVQDARQRALSLFDTDISAMEQVRDGLFDKNLAGQKMPTFEHVDTQSKKAAEDL